MALKINPTTGKLDFYTHHGIARYNFIGFTEQDPPLNPGAGNMAFNDAGMGDFSLVISRTDKDGHDLGYTTDWFAMGLLGYYDIWFWLHSKNDPTLYYGLWVGGIEQITEGEGEDEVVVGYYFPMFPLFVSMDYDAETDEYTGRDIPENTEVILSMDFVSTLADFGSMAEQDHENVYITGGSIAGVSISGVNISPNILNLPVKETTGDPDNIYGEPMIYINSFDQLIRVYAGGEWRTLLDFS